MVELGGGDPKTDLAVHAGSMAPLDSVITYEKSERYFVGQALTEDLPYVFELVPGRETGPETIAAEEH